MPPANTFQKGEFVGYSYSVFQPGGGTDYTFFTAVYNFTYTSLNTSAITDAQFNGQNGQDVFNFNTTDTGGGGAYQSQFTRHMYLPVQAEEMHSPAPVAAPVTEPVAEPVVEPVVEPLAEPLAEPVVEPFVAPVAEPVVEPLVDPVVEPVVQPVAEPLVEPLADPVVEPAVELVPEAVSEPVAEPVVDPVTG